MGRISLSGTLAMVCALVAVPVVFGLAALWKNAPIQVGEPSPRTVIAPTSTNVADPVATERARQEAAAAVEPVIVQDPQARAAIVQDVRDAFPAVEAARQPGPDGQVASPPEQVRTLSSRLPMLDTVGLELLVGLSDAQLDQVASEAVNIAQQLARERITPTELGTVAENSLQTELAVRSFPEGVADHVVSSVIQAALQPTVTTDQAATAEARKAAAENVAEVEHSFIKGSPIVTAGETVSEVQMRALQRRGLEGTDPWAELLKAGVLALVLAVVMSCYLRAYRPDVWRCPRRLLLLALLAFLFTIAIQGVTLLQIGGAARLYLIPVGAVAMLTTILFDQQVALLMLLPTTALVAYDTPSEPSIVAFAAVAGLASIPLVSRSSARGDLRRAAWQSTLAYGGIAAALAGVFVDAEAVLPAALAGLLGGVLTAMVVNGLLPFLDSYFGVLTATSLLDLADRNHPLLRELEQNALGTYSHSIMIATMVERACRAIGADSLLGSVAALYHDIGKVRQPYFYVENQFGIANPHDDLDPAVSATIIQEHVNAGIAMARAHRLPPEVIDGIASHHGTTLVSYFYRKAVLAAGDPALVDEEHYRYKGRKPSSREMAVLMLADCCESASRAAAQTDRNLSQQALEHIVAMLVHERVEDGQLDDSALTFAELRTVKQSFIETLVGVYHPRITYPEPVPAPDHPAPGVSQELTERAHQSS